MGSVLRRAGVVAVGAGALLAATATTSGAGAAETTARLSVTSAEQQANGSSFRPSVSGDGRRVAFESYARNLGADGSPARPRLLVRDRDAGTTRPVDLTPGGQPSQGQSYEAKISRNGRFVLFSSNGADLVPGDTNGRNDAFVRDLRSGTTVRASLRSNGQQISGNESFPRAISADGRFVVFDSSARVVSPGGVRGVLVRDLRQGTTTLASVATGGANTNGNSEGTSISGDGRFVGFTSSASNLVPNDTNDSGDAFVRDLRGSRTTRVSVGAGGAPANGDSFLPFVSGDGNIVAFHSEATNLVTGDTNGRTDVFVRDLKAGTTTRVSVAAGGGQGDGHSRASGISADGRRVLFLSDATNLVPGDSNGVQDAFVYDRVSKRTTRVTVTASGGQSNGFSNLPAISADGRTVVFESEATNLPPVPDTNGAYDVFARTLAGGGTR